MYTHMLWTTQARKEHLLNTKYFSCQCPRCADPTELGTHISALRCLAETSQVENHLTKATSTSELATGCLTWYIITF